jgi:hypothetical protein
MTMPFRNVAQGLSTCIRRGATRRGSRDRQSQRKERAAGTGNTSAAMRNARRMIFVKEALA